ncbi:MAG: DUF2817 domain-containing protein [Sandaracinaceae bacterium]|nr:DUF2817 domain-containing protein [Sandaracinaceae bacterium]
MPTLDELRLFAKYHLVRRPGDGPEPETELGVVSLGYDADAYVAQLRGYADRFEVTTLAELEHAGRSYPVLSVRVPAEVARKRLLVLAGVHGNEHAGLLAVPDLLDALATDRPRDVELVFVTPVNPIGAAHLSRYDGGGYDVNRDFVRFETPEARVVRDVVDAARPDFAIALHEGPQDASFMFTNPSVPRALAERVLAAIEAGGTRLATTDYFGKTLSPPGLAPVGRAGKLVNALWASTLGMMASGEWFDRRGVPEITFESSWRLPSRDARVRGHVDLVLAVARELSDV